jgi:hypothetical protein
MSVERVEVPADPAVFAEWMTADVGDDGATRKELCALWKCGERMVSRHLQMAQAAGMLTTGYRTVQDISGRKNRSPVYSFTQRKK